MYKKREKTKEKGDKKKEGEEDEEKKTREVDNHLIWES